MFPTNCSYSLQPWKYEFSKCSKSPLHACMHIPLVIRRWGRWYLVSGVMWDWGDIREVVDGETVLRWRVPMSLEGSRRTAITNEKKERKCLRKAYLVFSLNICQFSPSKHRLYQPKTHHTDQNTPYRPRHTIQNKTHHTIQNKTHHTPTQIILSWISWPYLI